MYSQNVNFKNKLFHFLVADSLVLQQQKRNPQEYEKYYSRLLMFIKIL